MKLKYIKDWKDIYHVLIQFNSSFFRPFGETEEELKRYAKKLEKYSNCLVVIEQNQVIGAVDFYANNEIEKSAYITFFVLTDKIQRTVKGAIVFGKIMEELLEYGNKNEIQYVTFEVDQENEYLLNLYKKIGCKIVEDSRERTLRMNYELKKGKCTPKGRD